MVKLLKAELFRLFKNKIFIISTILLYVLNIYKAFCDQSGGSIEYSYEPFTTAWVIPFAAAVIISFNNSSDSMIGNKLVMGYSKRQVYFSNLISAFIMSLIMSSSMLVGGIRLAICANINVGVLLIYYFLVIFAICAMSSVFVFITLSVGKKAPALLICVVMCAGILFSTYKTDYMLRQAETMYQNEIVSSEEYEEIDKQGNIYTVTAVEYKPNIVKNPDYIDGTKRTLYNFICYGSPYNIIYNASGYQLYWAECGENDVLECFQKYYIDNLAVNSISVATSLMFIACSTAFGLYLFKKRDIK